MGAKTSAAQAVKKSAPKAVAKPLANDVDSDVAVTTKSGAAKVLSEADILKASEKDYMNAAQLAFFRNRLHDMEQEILKNAGETTEHLRETIIVPDPADRGHHRRRTCAGTSHS